MERIRQSALNVNAQEPPNLASPPMPNEPQKFNQAPGMDQRDNVGRLGPASDEPQVTQVRHQPLGANPTEADSSFNNRVASSLTEQQRQAYNN